MNSTESHGPSLFVPDGFIRYSDLLQIRLAQLKRIADQGLRLTPQGYEWAKQNPGISLQEAPSRFLIKI